MTKALGGRFKVRRELKLEVFNYENALGLLKTSTEIHLKQKLWNFWIAQEVCLYFHALQGDTC